MTLQQRFFGFFLAACYVALGVGCAGGERPLGIDSAGQRARHLILIVVDTLRADVLGCYGGEAATPWIDSLASQGVRFEHAYSHIPITGPAHSTMFTSLLPSEHGVHNNAQVLDEEHLTLAELLAAQEWRTAAFISLGVLQKQFGLAQGFVEYHQWFDGDWWHHAGEVNEKLLPWIETLGPEKLFLFVHYSDPHEPYAAPDIAVPDLRLRCDGEVIGAMDARGGGFSIPLEVPPGTVELIFEADVMPLQRPVVIREIRVREPSIQVTPMAGVVEQKKGRTTKVTYRSNLPARFVLTNPDSLTVQTKLDLRFIEKLTFAEMKVRYIQETEFVDQEIGRLLESIRVAGLWDESLIVLTSDHGEGLGDHNLGGHIHQLYNSLLRVPLIAVSPDRLPAGKTVAAAVSLLDLLPTCVDLLAVDAPDGLRGRSVVPLIAGSGAENVIVAETHRPQAIADRFAVIEGGIKYIVSTSAGREELFDLEVDPGELTDLAGKRPQDISRLRDLLKTELALMSVSEGAEDSQLSEEERSQLEALGYVADSN